MINLAGRADCDEYIRLELSRCGIEIVKHPEPCLGEVASKLTGKLGNFTFERAWYYWMVKGLVPLEVAKILYEIPVGKTDIRVAGHCACPPPEHPWLTYRNQRGQEVHLDPTGENKVQYEKIRKEYEDCEVLPQVHFVKEIGPFIDSYV